MSKYSVSYEDTRGNNMSEKDYYDFIYKNIQDNLWQNLQFLNLSNNKLTILPKELGTLPLRELVLSKNLFGSSPQFTWTWLNQLAIQNNLCILDMSNNLLLELPVQIRKLYNLIMLDVSDNMLKSVPQSIGFLKNLNWLTLNNNQLSYLPGSIKQNLNLQYLNISKNPFSNFVRKDINCLKMPSLLEQSARCIIKNRIAYDFLPPLLIEYLDNAKCCCQCNEACFDSYVMNVILQKQQYLAEVVSAHFVRRIIPLVYYSCYFCTSSIPYGNIDVWKT